jgi:two-component system response regulator (stage 0 sporulation protein F)
MILVVDDNTELLKSVRRGLSRRGFEVELANDGSEAYDLLQKKNVECMVLDLGLPKINGAELLMLMQSEGIDVPVVVITGFGDYSEDELKEFTVVRKLISKPFRLDALADAVADCCA